MKRIGVVGAGRFGSSLAETLARLGAEVVLLDRARETVQRMASIVTRAAQGDAAEVRVLIDAGFGECDAAVVAIGANMEGSILATLNLKEIGVPKVVAKAASDMHGKVLDRVGADEVVYPNRERAQRLARSLLARSAIDYFAVSQGLGLVQMKAPVSFVGKTLVEAEIRKKYGLTVLVIERAGDGEERPTQILIPSGNEVIKEDDVLLVFGSDDKLKSVP